jgi:hypothetical protein
MDAINWMSTIGWKISPMKEKQKASSKFASKTHVKVIISIISIYL